MASHKMMSLLVVSLLFAVSLRLSEAHGAQLGVTYGTMGDNLPTPQAAVRLLEANNISSVRLLEPNTEILTALKGKNIEVILGFPNDPIPTFPIVQVENWLKVNVTPFLPDVKIKYIVVGNDMSRNSDNNRYSFAGVDIIVAMDKALQKLGLKDIKVTTSLDSSTLIQLQANPAPSTAAMWNESDALLHSILPILSKSGAPLMVNLYPYYEHVLHPNDVKADFALFTAKDNFMTDGKLVYKNKFDAMLDRFYTVLEKAGHPEMEVIVAETGWPSAGGVAATLENEKTYIHNLVIHLNKGTPKRPNKPIQVYINLFDENKRGIPTVEPHFGVFTADGKPKFPVRFTPAC